MLVRSAAARHGGLLFALPPSQCPRRLRRVGRTEDPQGFGYSGRHATGRAGRIRTKTDYQGEETHYQYDRTHRLVSLHNGAYLQVSYHYDGAGRLLNRILSNGVQTDYQYDGANRLTQLTSRTATGEVVAQQEYAHDAAGYITEVIQDVDGDGTADTVHYGYDPVYRLASADYPGTEHDESYTYDGVGNRQTFTRNGTTLHYVTGPGNRLLAVRQGSATGPVVSSYEYDANGNRTATWPGAIGTGTALHTATYDTQDRMASLTVAGTGAVHFKYDPWAYRIAKQTPTELKRSYLEGEHLEAVYDGAGAVQRTYLRGVVVDEIVNGTAYDGPDGEENRTFHHDHLRSVIGVSSHDGAVVERLIYTPFGELLTHEGRETSTLRYTGREFDDETGLYYYRARYYDPEVGRFLTEDPLGFGAGVNFYAYVNNNPLNFTDPSGHVLTPDLALDVGFIGWDVWDIVRAGPTTTNVTVLGLDVLGAVIPGVTGLGAIYKASKKAGNIVEGVYKKGRAAATQGAATGAVNAAKSAFEIAKQGGKHSGFLKNYLRKSPKEIQRGIKSLEKQIAEHQSKIRDPSKHIKDFNKLDPRQQKALVEKKWPSDIQRQQEQLDILKGLRSDS